MCTIVIKLGRKSAPIHSNHFTTRCLFFSVSVIIFGFIEFNELFHWIQRSSGGCVEVIAEQRSSSPQCIDRAVVRTERKWNCVAQVSVPCSYLPLHLMKNTSFPTLWSRLWLAEIWRWQTSGNVRWIDAGKTIDIRYIRISLDSSDSNII